MGKQSLPSLRPQGSDVAGCGLPPAFREEVETQRSIPLLFDSPGAADQGCSGFRVRGKEEGQPCPSLSRILPPQEAMEQILGIRGWYERE